MRQLLVSALALSLSGSPALAQSLHEGSPATAHPLRDAVRAEASKLADAQSTPGKSDDYMPGGMKPGYFWTSIGLMSAGGVYLVTGALVNSECVTLGNGVSTCSGIGTGVAVLGAGLIGGGVLLYILGKNDAKKAGNPEIQFRPHGVAVRGRINF